MGLAGLLDRYVPAWLADAFPTAPSWGFRFRRCCELLVDATLEVMLEGSLASVGRGTPTALPYLGQEWGVVRGRLDTDATYQTKLSSWIDRAKAQGSAYQLAREMWEYLGDSRVRVITRWGFWIDISVGGTISTYTAAWNWDSVSNPERANYWSDLWIVINPTWAVRPGTLGAMTGADGFVLGQLAPVAQVDVIKKLAARKAAHSCVRAIIWTSDATRFDPSHPPTMPDGTWGQWSIVNGGNHQIPSGRDLTTCRYWEPRG
jgi:hypothetical protein